jgi:hypothetical protein
MIVDKIKLLIFSLLLISCTKETVKPEDPNPTTVELNSPISFNYRSIEISANIKYLNKKDTIIEHGFAIKSLHDDSYPEKTFTINGTPNVGVLNYVLPNTTDFDDNKSYRYYYYIKTNSKTIKSETQDVSFTRIVVNPKSSLYRQVGEYVEIEGDFLGIKNEYILYYDFNPENIVPFELLNDNKLIRFKIPANNFHGVHLHFRLKKKNSSEEENNIFIAEAIVLGTITAPSRYNLYYDDHIDVKSIDHTYGLSDGVKLFIGQKFLTFFPNLQLRDFIHDQPGNTFSIGYTNGRDTVVFQQKISLILPNEKDFKTIEPIAHPNSSFNISGLDLNKFGSGDLRVGGKSAVLINHYMTYGNHVLSIDDLSDGEYALTLRTSNFNYTSSNKIKVQSLRFNSITPVKARKNDIVSLHGNFVVNQSYQILLNNKVVAEAICKKSNELKFLIDNNQPIGLNEVRVSYRSAQTEKPILSSDKLTLEII